MTPHLKNRTALGQEGLWPHFQSPSFWVAVFAILLAALSPAKAQFLPGELDDIHQRLAEKALLADLANPNEEALLQVLIEVALARDALIDTAVVYDIIVHYDPNRYQNPRVGTYPLRFEEQLVFWGKRVAHYTKSTEWKSGRFYLRDLSTGRVAWLFTADARRLYAPSKAPRTARDISPYTDLQTTGQWLRAIHEEDRDAVERRLRQEAQQRAQSLTKDLKK